jgi:hypothetical protein
MADVAASDLLRVGVCGDTGKHTETLNFIRMQVQVGGKGQDLPS